MTIQLTKTKFRRCIIVLVFGAATINVAGQSVQQRSKQSSSEILNVARNTLGGEAKLSSSATVGEQLLPHPNLPRWR